MTTTNFTTSLGIALPTTGDLSGTWGDTVNDYISKYLDAAVAGALTVSTDVTLTKTTNSALGATSSQYAILIASGHSANITVTAPAISKVYLVINKSGSYTVKIRGAGPTTGITVPVSTAVLVAWDGSDFALVSSTDVSSLSGVLTAVKGGTGQSSYAVGDLLYASTTTALSKLADVATGNALISGGVGVAPSYGKIGLTTHVDGTLPVANGGTGAASLTANNVLLGNGTSAVQVVAPGTSGNVLTSNGTTWQSAAPTIAVNSQEFTSSGTWTKPAGASFVQVELWGAGGGGGGGCNVSGGTFAGSGGAGGGGGYTTRVFKASDLSATVAVTVGTGGSGGAGNSAGSPGADGAAGGNTTFGALLTAFGGAKGTGGSTSAGGLGGGGGGVMSPAPSGTTGGFNAGSAQTSGANMSGGTGDFGGGAGGGASTSNIGQGGGSFRGGSGGGSGGSCTSSGSSGVDGAAGGTYTQTVGGGGLQGSNFGAGTTVRDGGNGGAFQGGGGGAAYYSATSSAPYTSGNGGNGGTASGGGGGGACPAGGFTVGSGGAGGNGLARIYSW